MSVILVTVNGFGPVALLTSDVFRAVAQKFSSLTINAEFSFSPAQELQKLNKGARIYGTLLGKDVPLFAGAIAFEADDGVIVVAVEAELWLSWAAAYEAKLKQVKESLKEEIKKDAEAIEPKLELVK